MKLKYSRNVLHLSITKNTALRVVLYVPQNKIDWYNENDLHSQVLETLHPIIVNNLVKDQGQALSKRQKEGETNTVIQKDGYRILYRFTLRNSQETLIKTEKEFDFTDKAEDEKPNVITTYKSLSIYPFQLLVSVDDELFINKTNNIESYFQIL